MAAMAIRPQLPRPEDEPSPEVEGTEISALALLAWQRGSCPDAEAEVWIGPVENAIMPH